MIHAICIAFLALVAFIGYMWPWGLLVFPVGLVVGAMIIAVVVDGYRLLYEFVENVINVFLEWNSSRG